jgi:transcriptional regulator with XRE-family HTH domain
MGYRTGRALVVVPEWTMGERLAKARKEAKLTQAQIARQLGVSPATVAAWEVNRNHPRDVLALVHRWSEITEVDIMWIIGLDPSADNPRYVQPSLFVAA